jgi:hypothetical protein
VSAYEKRLKHCHNLKNTINTAKEEGEAGEIRSNRPQLHPEKHVTG